MLKILALVQDGHPFTWFTFVPLFQRSNSIKQIKFHEKQFIVLIFAPISLLNESMFRGVLYNFVLSFQLFGKGQTCYIPNSCESEQKQFQLDGIKCEEKNNNNYYYCYWYYNIFTDSILFTILRVQSVCVSHRKAQFLASQIIVTNE